MTNSIVPTTATTAPVAGDCQEQHQAGGRDAPRAQHVEVFPPTAGGSRASEDRPCEQPGQSATAFPIQRAERA